MAKAMSLKEREIRKDERFINGITKGLVNSLSRSICDVINGHKKYMWT
jgi:hypothetical protein